MRPSIPVVAGQFLGQDRETCEAFSRAMVSSYRKHIREYANIGYLALRYQEIREKDLLRATPDKFRKRLNLYLAKAKKRTHLQVLEKMTDLIEDQHRIVESAPLVVRETHTEDGTPIQEALGVCLQQYLASLRPDRRDLLSRYQILDVARKVVGVGTSAPAAGSSSCGVSMSTIRSSCRSRMPSLRCFRLISKRPVTRIRDSASYWASA
jgi:hypothetical protein